MSSRVVVIDDKTQQEIPQGIPYFNLTIRYYENDMQYQTASPRYMYKDTLNWSDVVAYLNDGIPSTAVEVTIVKK